MRELSVSNQPNSSLAMEDTDMIDNKQIGGSIDLDDKDEVAESIQKFVKNIKVYR